MGKKKRSHPDVEELISRPWCYYCQFNAMQFELPNWALANFLSQASEISRISSS